MNRRMKLVDVFILGFLFLVFVAFVVKDKIKDHLDRPRLTTSKNCISCGLKLTEIRGKYPTDPSRLVCACCKTEALERIEQRIKEKSTCKVQS